MSENFPCSPTPCVSHPCRDLSQMWPPLPHGGRKDSASASKRATWSLHSPPISHSQHREHSRLQAAWNTPARSLLKSQQDHPYIEEVTWCTQFRGAWRRRTEETRHQHAPLALLAAYAPSVRHTVPIHRLGKQDS